MTTCTNSVNTTADTMAEYNEYLEGLEHSLAEVKEYATDIKTTTTTEAVGEALKSKLFT